MRIKYDSLSKLSYECLECSTHSVSTGIFYVLFLFLSSEITKCSEMRLFQNFQRLGS